MTAYTSTGSGNWNDASKWGGSGYPSSAADTATISTAHQMTIPVGVTIDCGAITLNAGSSSSARTKIINNGRLNINGAVALAANTALEGNNGFVYDLKGNTITPSGDTEYTMLGSAETRGKFYSSTTPGGMATAASPCKGNWQNVDISNLTGAQLHRSHTSANALTFLNNTVTNCTGKVYLDSTGTNGSASYDVRNNTFSNPANANPTSATAEQPHFNNQALYVAGTVRRFENNVLSQSSRTYSAIGVSFLRCSGMVFRDNVFYNWQLGVAGRSADVGAQNQYFNNLLIIDADSSAVNGEHTYSSDEFCYLQGNYVYNNTGGHPFPRCSAISAANMPSYSRNILDSIDGTIGLNWYLFGLSSVVSAYTVKNNLMLGTGNIVCHVNNCVSPIVWQSNTIYGSNGGDTSQAFGTLGILEQSVTTLTSVSARVLNNLSVQSNSAVTDFVVTGELTSSIATDAIDYLDYNCGYALNPNATQTPPLKYGSKIVVTAGNGPHDFSENPQFTDVGRNICTFDASLGGSGTAASAFANFIARAAGYTVANLMDYVWSGYRVANVNLRGTGENGVNISAANYYDSSRNLSVMASINSYLSSIYV